MNAAELMRDFESLGLKRPRTSRLRPWGERFLNRFFPQMDRNIARVLWRRGRWRKLANYLLVEGQVGRMNTRVWGKPYWLTIDPTNFCQLRCPFCPTGAERKVRAKAILDVKDYERLLDELGPVLLHIDFMNWGEPLLHPHLFDMIAYAKKFAIDTHVSTNFNEFDEATADRMVRSGLDAVTLSIDGLSQKTYEKYRVRGDYNKVIENLKTLVRKRKELGRSNPYIIWQFLVFKHNEHEVERVREVALDLGVDTVGITPAFLPFRPGIKDEWLPSKPEHRHYDPETFPDSPPWEWPDPAAASKEGGRAPGSNGNGSSAPTASGPVPGALAEPAPARPGTPSRVAGILRRILNRRSNADGSPVIDVKVYQETEQRPVCTWPWAGVTVNPNGSVSPCCSVEEDIYDFGNIFRDGFRKVWNNPHYVRSRRHVRDYVNHRTDVKTRSDHACERCFTVGRANFTFQPWWRFEQYDWWWGLTPPPVSGTKGPASGGQAGGGVNGVERPARGAGNAADKAAGVPAP